MSANPYSSQRILCGCGATFDLRFRRVESPAAKISLLQRLQFWRRVPPPEPPVLNCPRCAAQHLISSGAFDVRLDGEQIHPLNPSEAVKLRQYDVQVDVLKFYFELVVKVEAFFYALTGAVLTYVLAHWDQEVLRRALWLPVILGAAIAVIEVFGIRALRFSTEEMERIARGLRLATWPSVRILKVSLQGAVAVRVVTLGALLWLILWPPKLAVPAAAEVVVTPASVKRSQTTDPRRSVPELASSSGARSAVTPPQRTPSAITTPSPSVAVPTPRLRRSP